MKKIIIPRRDHEVYFILLPDNIKARQIRAFAVEQLGKLHPAFSAMTVFYMQHLIFNKVRYIMATVMEEETLAEYKIINKGAAFYTNTSIMVHKNNFLDGGIITIDDERIGFDSENNCPVSLPLETEINCKFQELEHQLNAIPKRSGVFPGKTPHWHIALAASAITLLLLTSSVYIFSPKSAPFIQPVIIHAESAAETKSFPSALNTLVKVTCGVIEAGGELLRWQYNEDSEPLLVMQLQGLDILAIHQIFSPYDYIFLQDIKSVSYIDGIPHVTINVNAVKADYEILAAAMFPGQSSAFSMIMDLVNNFQQNNISIITETLPTSGNGFYSISYTASGNGLVQSLEIINEICGKYPLSVKNMDISISGDRHLFTVGCALAYMEKTSEIETIRIDEKNNIPFAFGYRVPMPPIIPRIELIPEPIPELPIIGSIISGGVQMVFYRDTSDGKMKIRESK